MTNIHEDNEDSDTEWPAATQEELDDLWRRRVKHDLLSLTLADKDDEDATEVLRKRYERVREIRLVPEEFTQEAGELTPTLKLKRRQILARYEDAIEEMYSGPAPDA